MDVSTGKSLAAVIDAIIANEIPSDLSILV